MIGFVQTEKGEKMTRYIDADALKDKITEIDDGCAIDGTGFDIYTCEVFELIDEVPAADVKPVVRGEWKECEVVQEHGDEPIIDEWQSARCSVCGKYHTTPYMYYFDNFNYCPNCGAEMGGDSK